MVKVNEKAHENSNLLLENYRKSVKNMVDFMIGIKNRVYSSFVKVNAINNDSARIDSNILRKPLIANL